MQDELFHRDDEQAVCQWCGRKIYKRPRQIAICGKCTAYQQLNSNGFYDIQKTEDNNTSK